MCFACEYICIPSACLMLRVEEGSGPLKQELQMVVNCYALNRGLL